jgi:hypothetical protein
MGDQTIKDTSGKAENLAQVRVQAHLFALTSHVRPVETTLFASPESQRYRLKCLNPEPISLNSI